MLIGAVAGHVELHAPCGSGASVYVADLAQEPLEEEKECECGRPVHLCMATDSGLDREHGDRK